jgi:hypothetical protein
VCGGLSPFTDFGLLPTRQVRIYAISVFRNVEHRARSGRRRRVTTLQCKYFSTHYTVNYFEILLTVPLLPGAGVLARTRVTRVRYDKMLTPQFSLLNSNLLVRAVLDDRKLVIPQQE